MTKLLDVSELSISFPTMDGEVQANLDINFDISAGETVAIVGESGSGKSVASMAILGLHNRTRAKISGQINFFSKTGVIDIASADEESVRRIRGKEIAMIFQDPMSSLHPYFTIGAQIAEAWSIHNEGTRAEAWSRAVEMLELVEIPMAEKRANDFPHQFSGGMRQRAMIAMALVNKPSLLIADEPTTALDVTVQTQILELLKGMQKEFNMGVILITHDLGVVAEVADRVNVMYAGRIVETASVQTVFLQPSHPYTLALLNSIPRVNDFSAGKLKVISGTPPSLINLPNACSFTPRCEHSSKVQNGLCLSAVPEIRKIEENHWSRCFLTNDQVKEIRK